MSGNSIPNTLANKRRSKRYRRTQLDDFLDLANLLPADATLPEPRLAHGDSDLLYQLTRRFLSTFSRRRSALALREEVFYLAKETSPVGIIDADPTVRARWRSHDRLFLYDLFYSVRETLEKLVIASEGVSTGGVLQTPLMVNLPTFGRALTIDEKGKLVRYRDVFYDNFLDGCLIGKDLTRLRRCPICGKFFWAWRKDKGACSPPCLDTNRVRNSRHPGKRGRYAKNRIRNKLAKETRESKSPFYWAEFSAKLAFRAKLAKARGQNK